MSPARHVRLGPLTPQDAEPITRAMRDWDVVRWLPEVHWPYGTDDAMDMIGDRAAGARDRMPGDLAIRVEGRLVGLVRAGRGPGVIPSIWVAPDWQRRGIGARASTLALARAFRDGTRASVRAAHVLGNHRGAALLARLGFRDAGEVALFSRPEGATVEGRAMTLTRAAFDARHGVTVATRRLVLDRVRPADLPALRAIATEPSVARMLLMFHDAMAEAEFAALFPDQTLMPPFRLAVRRAGRVIGSIGVGPGDTPAIFYFLAPDCEGEGLATEMVEGFVHEIVARFGLPLLRAQVCVDNPASRRVLEKAGFVVTGDIMLTSRARPAPAPGWAMERRTAP